ncbi:protein rolling stone-like [Mizuhopecten yessoensis]|uniref:Protein rolling stone n=1 Tax=Mizuhopecten yessoensis TaxID=6573 RepID=A0A210R3M2_MIZYE|nr:protein rolling stone-like [Mizuhopecten yessoensis]OWF55579.1 Protein rolling stone [Mizuhopecten yessoensis]
MNIDSVEPFEEGLQQKEILLYSQSESQTLNLYKMGFKEKLKSEFSISNIMMTHPEPHLFVTMQCGPVHLYPIWSMLWSAYHLAWIILDMYFAATDEQDDGHYFKFLTNWGYLFLVSYQWLDTAASVYIHLRRKELIKGGQDSMPWYLKVIWVLYNIANSLALIIVLLYWMLIGSSLHPKSISKHALNGMCVLFNICFTATPIRVWHFYQPVLVCFVYAIFSIIYQQAGGGLIYDMLDWDKPGATIGLVLPLLVVGMPLAHLCFFGIYKARTDIAKQCCTGIVSTVKPVEEDVESTKEEVTDCSKEEVTDCSKKDVPTLLTVDDLTKDHQTFSLRLTPGTTQRSINVSMTPSPTLGFVNAGSELDP